MSAGTRVLPFTGIDIRNELGLYRMAVLLRTYVRTNTKHKTFWSAVTARAFTNNSRWYSPLTGRNTRALGRSHAGHAGGSSVIAYARFNNTPGSPVIFTRSTTTCRRTCRIVIRGESSVRFETSGVFPFRKLTRHLFENSSSFLCLTCFRTISATRAMITSEPTVYDKQSKYTRTFERLSIY